MCGDHDAHLGHLAGPVWTRLVMHHDDLLRHRYRGPHGQPAPAGEVLGPRGDSGAQLEGVEVHVAQRQGGGTQPVLP